MSDDRRWWESAFGPDYLAVYSHRDDKSAMREAAFAARILGVEAPAHVLDAGCGAGRHARALSAAGFRVVGADRSIALLAEAAGRGGAARYVAADVRTLPIRTGSLDAVVSFFSSFGYFDADGDRRHAREMRRVLRARGGLLLDFLNAPRVAADLVPSSERRVGPRTIRETRAIRRGRVEKQVEVTEDGRTVAAWSESVRLYEREELVALLRDAGFRVVAEFGGLANVPWSATADRLVVHAVAA